MYGNSNMIGAVYRGNSTSCSNKRAIIFKLKLDYMRSVQRSQFFFCSQSKSNKKSRNKQQIICMQSEMKTNTFLLLWPDANQSGDCLSSQSHH